MKLSLFASGLAAFVLMVLINTNVVKASDPTCFKRCGCGETIANSVVRTCNGGADYCFWTTCTMHKSGPNCFPGNENNDWNDECSALALCELQGSSGCAPSAG